jgi:hypothetical protein
VVANKEGEVQGLSWGTEMPTQSIANFSSMLRKLRSEREKIDEDSEIGSVVEGRRKSGVVGFTDAVKRRWQEVARASIKGGIVGLAVGCVGEEFHLRWQLQTWLRRK